MRGEEGGGGGERGGFERGRFKRRRLRGEVYEVEREGGRWRRGLREGLKGGFKRRVYKEG